MVQTTVRPVLTVLRTVRITIAAARASSPLVGSSCTKSGTPAGTGSMRIAPAGTPEEFNARVSCKQGPTHPVP